MRAPLFNAMGPAIADLSDPHHLARPYHRGEVIFRQGDMVDDCFFIVEGGVKIYRERLDGEQVVIAIFSTGEAYSSQRCSSAKVLKSAPRRFPASRVIRINRKLLRRLLERQPELAFEMLAAISDQYVRLVEQIEQLRGQSITQRVADFLLKIVQTTSGSAELALPYEKALIANSIGTKPECFSRALVKLREIGVHVKRNNVQISDVGRLIEHAGRFEPDHVVGREWKQSARPASSQQAPSWTGNADDVALPPGAPSLVTKQNFNATLAAEWRKSIHSGDPISLLLINIAQSEQLNDRQLGRKGQVLTAVRDAISTPNRSGDWLIAYYGDDAFAVTLPATSGDNARSLAEKIRRSIETSATIHAVKDGQGLTASVGVATIVPTGTDQVQKILCFADIALYRAKLRPSPRSSFSRSSILFQGEEKPIWRGSDSPPSNRLIALNAASRSSEEAQASDRKAANRLCGAAARADAISIIAVYSTSVITRAAPGRKPVILFLPKRGERSSQRASSASVPRDQILANHAAFPQAHFGRRSAGRLGEKCGDRPANTAFVAHRAGHRARVVARHDAFFVRRRLSPCAKRIRDRHRRPQARVQVRRIRQPCLPREAPPVASSDLQESRPTWFLASPPKGRVKTAGRRRRRRPRSRLCFINDCRFSGSVALSGRGSPPSPNASSCFSCTFTALRVTPSFSQTSATVSGSRWMAAENPVSRGHPGWPFNSGHFANIDHFVSANWRRMQAMRRAPRVRFEGPERRAIDFLQQLPARQPSLRIGRSSLSWTRSSPIAALTSARL